MVILLTSDRKGAGEVWEPYTLLDVPRTQQENAALWRHYGRQCACGPLVRTLKGLRQQLIVEGPTLPIKVAFDWFSNEIPRVHTQLRHMFRESHDGLWPADPMALEHTWVDYIRQFWDYRHNRVIHWPEPPQGWEGWRRARRIL